MKVLKLLRKEYPELDLTLQLDTENNTLIFSGKQTPLRLLNIGFRTEFKIANIPIYIRSINSPELRINRNINFGFTGIGLYIGGSPTNNPIFRVSKCIDDNSNIIRGIKQLFKSIELNKQIKVL